MKSPVENSLCEVPYAAAIDKECWEKGKEKWCFVCFSATSRLGLTTCGDCRAAFYCSPECRDYDANVTRQHKFECLVFQKYSASPEDEKEIRRERDTRLIARILARLGLDGGANPEGDFTGFPAVCSRRKFFDLMDHVEQFEDSPVFSKMWRNFCTYYKMISVPDNPWKKTTREQLLRIYGIVRTNSFRTVGDYGVFGGPERVGLAVYLQCSRFDHACEPDIYRYFDGQKLIMRPVSSEIRLKELSQEDLESLHISYHCWEGSLAPTLERSESLLAAFHFMCQCDKCLDIGLDRLQWTSLKMECPSCASPLVPSMAAEEEWRDPLKQPNVVFLYPDESARLPADCPVCGERNSSWVPVHKFYESMRNSMLASFAIDSPHIAPSAPIRDSHYLYTRLLEAEKTLHSVKNAWVFLGREVLLDAHFEPLWRTSGSEAARLTCVDLARKLVASWDYFEPTANEAQVLCAKIARWYSKGGTDKDTKLAIKWYEEAQRRWISKYGKDHYIPAQIQTILGDLKEE